MARDATARLYDVDEDSMVFNRLTLTGKYDEGEVVFKAKKGKRISLDKLYESIWATRLSGGTRSGLVKLEITVVGQVVARDKELILKVKGEKPFVLCEDVEDASPGFRNLRAAVEAKKNVVSVTGRVEGWRGRWPGLLRKPPPRQLAVLDFETAS